MKDVAAESGENFSRLRHVLRISLNQIIGYAEMLADDAADLRDEANAAALKSVRQDAQRVCDAIQALNTRAEPDELQRAIQSLRNGIGPEAVRMHATVSTIRGLNQTDIDQVAAAASDVLAFARKGTLPASAMNGQGLRENERLKMELARCSEELQRFVYTASHDLQAPVRTITTYLQLLQRRMGARINADEKEMLQFVERAAKRIHALIHDLLQFSQAITHEIRPEPVAANELLDSLLLEMEDIIAEGGAKVTRGDLPMLVYDPKRLRQLLRHLIDNAIRYRREQEPPHVHVTALRENDSWRFSIRDNGEGIAQEHLGQIFDVFRRLHGEEIPGSGIGLSICKRIIERTGGRIWVESQVGEGSDFSFTIPFATAAELENKAFSSAAGNN